MSPSLDPFERHIRRFLVDRDLSAQNRRLLIGVSGGPDSVALLVACNAVRERLGVFVHVVHVNHGLRGIASRADAAYVARLCRRLAVPITVVNGDIGPYRQSPGLASQEVAARYARYAAFAAVARDTMATAILVAHTADDQVETVLMNLMRGAGLRGTAGMRPVATLPRVPGASNPLPTPLARPLLEVTRTQVNQYLRSRRLRPRLDESNADPRHLRNRVRHELVPLMEAIRSGSASSLLRASFAVEEAEEALSGLADRAWSEVASVETPPLGGVSVTLSSDALLDSAIPKLTRKMVFAHAYERVTGTREGLGSRHLAAVDRLLHARKGSIDLPRSVLASRARGVLILAAGSSWTPTQAPESCPGSNAHIVRGSETSTISP